MAMAPAHSMCFPELKLHAKPCPQVKAFSATPPTPCSTRWWCSRRPRCYHTACSNAFNPSPPPPPPSPFPAHGSDAQAVQCNAHQQRCLGRCDCQEAQLDPEAGQPA